MFNPISSDQNDCYDYDVIHTQHDNLIRTCNHLQLNNQLNVRTSNFDHQQINSMLPVTNQSVYSGYQQSQPNLYKRQQPPPSQSFIVQNDGNFYTQSYPNCRQTQDQVQVHQQKNNYSQQYYTANLCNGNHIAKASHDLQKNNLNLQQNFQTLNFDYHDHRQSNSMFHFTNQSVYRDQPNLYSKHQPPQKNHGHLYTHSFSNRDQAQDHIEVHQHQNSYAQQYYPAELYQENQLQQSNGK